MSQMSMRSSELPPGSHDSVGPNDVFAEVMGPEKNGRVCMLGLGINQADEWGTFHTKNIPFRVFLEQQITIDKLNDRLQLQEERYNHLYSMIQEQRGISSPSLNRVPSSSSNYFLGLNNTPRPLVVNASISIKSVMDQTTVVAKGYIVDMNPSKDVGGHPLGKNWCEVNVQVAIEPDEPLMRPYSIIQTIGEALGTSIAWPMSLVQRDEE